MDGHDDFADWPSSYRDQRTGREERRGYGSADRNDYEDELRVPAPRSGDARYGSPAELNAGPEPGTWVGEPERQRGRDRDRGERRGERYPASPPPYEHGYENDGGAAARRGGGWVDPDFAPRGARSAEQMPPVESMPMHQLPPAQMPPQMPPQMAPPAPEAFRQRTETIDSAAVRRSVAESDGMYRTKKPGMAVLFGAIAGLGELLMLRPLLAGLFKTAAGPALAPLLAMVAFPMLALGLYALTTGAATAVQFQGPRVWLRTPLVYLVVGAALMLAAATAA